MSAMSDEQVVIARAIAHIAHKGQVDKSGNPYIGHPARVAEDVGNQGHSGFVIAAAWLHDVLEDTDITREDLYAAGILWNVIGMVEDLTRTSEVSPEAYYENLAGKFDAREVKLADIADNTNPDRLALLDDATIARLTRKYAKARLLLGAAK